MTSTSSSTTTADTDEDTPPSSTSTNNDTNSLIDNHPSHDDDDDKNSTTLTSALQILYTRHQLKRSLTLSELDTLLTAVDFFPKWIMYGFLECSVTSHGGVEMLDVQQVVQLSEEMKSMMGYGADGVKAGKATSSALLYYMWLRVKSVVGDDEDEGGQMVEVAERGGQIDRTGIFEKCRDLTSGEDGLKVTRMMDKGFDEDDEDPDKTPRPKPKTRKNIKLTCPIGEDKGLETPTTPTPRRKPRDGEMIKKPRKSADMPYLSPSSPLRRRITRVSRPENQQHQQPRSTELTTHHPTPTGNSPKQGQLQSPPDHSNCTTCTTPKHPPSTGFRILRAVIFIILSALILLIGAAIPPLLVGYYSKNPGELAALRDRLKWIADFGNSVWSAGWNDGLGGLKEVVMRGAKIAEKAEKVDLGKWERWRLWVGGILGRGRRGGGTG
ncbi:hypothetical protein EX30DRAFT_395230 [Ascodesmis nigricans]|uniref:Uncharacterized protein n=1 Tax=Ascodesmis nigricans TaxID=341454 RepID=A0A4S2MYJ6_9PEZI|nr:hypothetical protein EX30DRAFT_395230 [Ascodesmis nigricans]